jgi:Glutaredoxin-like domain (DUF836)
MRLYTRAGCHLCEVARAQLLQGLRDYNYALHEIDVDSDPGLVSLYGDWVPVVTINGRVRFRGAVNSVLLRRLLKRG